MMQAVQPRSEVIVHLRGGLVLAVSYLVLFRDDGAPTSPAGLAYVAVLLASNVFFTQAYSSAPDDRILRLLPFADAVLVVWGLVAFESPRDLIVAWFLCIVAGAFGDSEERVAGAAFLVTGVYAMWLLSGSGAGAGPPVLLRLPFLFVTTAFYAYVMQRIRTERSERRRAEAQARTLDLLLEVTRFFSSTAVTTEVLERVAETVRVLLRARRCRIVSEARVETAEPLVAEALRRGSPVAAERIDVGEARRVVVVPIVHELEVLGALWLERDATDDAPRGDEMQICRLVADAAALALKNAQRTERLLELQQRHSRMIRVLSHEVRVPLQLLVAQVQFANEQANELDDRELRFLVRKVEQAASEFSGHIDDLLRQSLVLADREQRQVSRIDVPALLEHTVESIRRLAEPGTVELSLEVEAGIGEIYADPEKLQRVLQHVLLNAVKLAHGGSIRLTASVTRPETGSRREPTLALSVEDVAVDADSPAAAEAGESATPGFDLAASLRELIEMLDGRIRYEVRPGGHAAFRIFVPFESAATEP